jgi:GalNAc-alpha-(1->4)-GalNAc-alpha-(1->3)-diNAcBac-PP-undecaprenol alpha-1,4-N-acetyl-D-galactosaminyltransferase
MGTRDVPVKPFVTTEARSADRNVTPRTRRRIVIVVSSIATGGAERVAATMANAWLERGHEVWLVSTYLGPRTVSYPLNTGVAVLFLSESALVSGRSRGPQLLRKTRALRSILLTIRPDVIISFLTNVNVLTLIARASSGIPLIISERTDPLHDTELPVALRMARALCYRFADALVVQTAAAARRYGARLRGLRGISVIHNPLPAQLAASPARTSQDGEGGCVIAMGRLSAEKGYSKLIEAFGSALGGDAGWRLRIWGDGPLRQRLQSLVDRRQLAERVELCGVTNQPWDALAAGQVFVLSSEYEGFPNAMLEAMAVGLPCVAFDCPSGARELADGGHAAILVPCGDSAALAAALRELARDRELRRTLGARAATFVRSQFSQQSVMADWDALIEEVLARRDADGQRARSSAPGR